MDTNAAYNPDDPTLTGINSGVVLGNPTTAAEGIDAVPSSFGDWFNPAPLTRSVFEGLSAEIGASGVDPETGVRFEPPEPDMTAAEANTQYPGMNFSGPVQPSIARMQFEAHQEAADRASVEQRVAPGFWNATGYYATGLLNEALDPVNAASMFIPGIGPDLMGESLLGRLATGAVEGAAVQAPLVGAQALASHVQGLPYAPEDALLDIAVGAGAGGLLHAGVGALRDFLGGSPEVTAQADAINNADLPARAGALRSAIAQSAEGRPVEVSAYFNKIDTATGEPIEQTPVFDQKHFDLMHEEQQLRLQHADLGNLLGNIEVPPNAQDAVERLSRLKGIDTTLADTTLSDEQRGAAEQRRDELLQGTSRESLQEAATPLALQQQTQSQQANIATRLGEIAQERRQLAINAALSPLPKLQTTPRLQEAVKYASGATLPEEVTASRMADAAERDPDANAVSTFMQANPDTDEAEVMRRYLEGTEEFMTPEDKLEAQNIDTQFNRDSSLAKGFAQAAQCIARGGM
jgi:hypothetical protein